MTVDMTGSSVSSLEGTYLMSVWWFCGPQCWRCLPAVSLISMAMARSRVRNSVFFFFQAEDGIRDYKVTGVQTCALPIYARGQQMPGSNGASAKALRTELSAGFGIRS